MPFLHTVYRKIQFHMAQAVDSRQKKIIVEEVKNVIKMYTDRGFREVDIHGDKEFKCILDDMSPTPVDIVASDKNMDEVERSIRVFNERCRCIINWLLYKSYTMLRIIKLVCTALRGLNQIPAEKVILDSISPLTIMTGQDSVDYNNLQADFGKYTQVYEEDRRNNTNAQQSLGAIILSMNYNMNGHYRFMSLNTGKLISVKQSTLPSITGEVKRRVEYLALAHNQPMMT